MGKTMNATIRLLGEVDPSVNGISSAISRLSNPLGKIGRDITSVGMGLTALSLPIIRAGKDIISISTTYEQAINRVQAITGVSDRAMVGMNAQLREFAVNTRYTPIQVADAFTIISQAGVELEDGLSFLGTVLNFATAGDIELSKAASILTTNMYATGTSFEYATEYADIMGTVARRSNTNLESLSEAVTRMGATSRYFGDNNQLLSWLGVLGNLGYDGAESGTYLRNVMLALAAPGGKAAEALESMGIDEGELNTKELTELQTALDEIAGDEKYKAIAGGIEEIGVKIYDNKGKMRPMVAILEDINQRFSTMTEQEKNVISNTIFPKRTVGAFGGMLQELDLYNKIYNETLNSRGTVGDMAKTMEKGMVGSQHMMQSAVEEMQLSIGKIIEPDVIAGAGKLREIALGISNMDEGGLRTWTSWAETIAVAGPAMTGVGLGLTGISKLLRLLTTPGGLLAVAAVGVTGLIVTMQQLEKQAVRNSQLDNYGILEFDEVGLQDRLNLLGSFYAEGVNKIKGYTQAVTESGEKYYANVSNIYQILSEGVMFKGELSQEEKDQLNNFGTSLGDNILEGIKNAKGSTNNILDYIFENGEKGKELKLLSDKNYGEIEAEANRLKGILQNTIGSALEDGVISSDEEATVRSIIEQMNRIMAKVQEGMAEDSFYTELAKAGSYSHDTMDVFTKNIDEKINAYEESIMGPVYAAAAQFLHPESYNKAAADEIIAAGKEKVKGDTKAFRDLASQTIVSNTSRAYEENLGVDFNKMFVDITEHFSFKKKPRVNIYTIPETEEVKELKKDIFNNKGDYINIVNDYINSLKYKSGQELFDEIKAYQDKGEAIPYELEKQEEFYKSAELINVLGGINKAGVIDNSVLNEAMFNLSNLNPEISLDTNAFSSAIEVAGQAGGNAAENFNNEIMGQIKKDISFDLNIYPNMNIISGGLGLPTSKGMMKYAEGGRADRASIFGEAGPEWAIPEERSQRTLDLLNRAANASGFTVRDFAPQSTGNNVFSPVIHMEGGGNKEDLEAALDKAFERFERIMSRKEQDKIRLSF